MRICLPNTFVNDKRSYPFNLIELAHITLEKKFYILKLSIWKYCMYSVACLRAFQKKYRNLFSPVMRECRRGHLQAIWVWIGLLLTPVVNFYICL